MASSSLSVNPNTGDVALAGNVNAPNLAMFRNKLINGDFSVWQRGTSFNVTTTGTYTADRWVIQFDGTGATRTVSQQTFTNGQTDVPNNPTYFLRYNQSVAGSGGTYNNVAQRIEGVRTLAGQTATVSFYAKADAARPVTVYLNQLFGTGGSPSASTFTTAGQPTLTSTWTKYTFTATLPSISGKTIGTNSNNIFELSLQCPSNTTFTIDLAQVQVEAGSQATPFEVLPQGLGLTLCQRYYVRMTANQLYSHFPAIGYVASSTNVYLSIILPTPQRTVGAFSYSGSFLTLSPNITSTGAITIDANSSSTTCARLNITVVGGTLGYASLLRSENSTASYLAFEAEL